MLIDTHCHLDFPEFKQDRTAVLEAARRAGVDEIINIGSSLEGSRRSVSLSREFPRIFSTVGIHPHDAKDCDEKAFLEIEELSRQDKVVAIGEVGLDYFRNLSLPFVQEDVFIRFLGLASRVAKPLVIHCRQAEKEILKILRQAPPSHGAVIHCFSGDREFLDACLAMGFHISFTATVTYKKAQNLRDLVKRVPLERMFLETDAPFLPPEGKRGQRNEPANVAMVAECVARIKGLSVEEVGRVTTQAARAFFKLP
ncbi:MAG: TatD family hydrolase [Candidatus Omnitrophota bacterium]